MNYKEKGKTKTIKGWAIIADSDDNYGIYIPSYLIDNISSTSLSMITGEFHKEMLIELKETIQKRRYIRNSDKLKVVACKIILNLK